MCSSELLFVYKAIFLYYWVWLARCPPLLKEFFCPVQFLVVWIPDDNLLCNLLRGRVTIVIDFHFHISLSSIVSVRCFLALMWRQESSIHVNLAAKSMIKTRLSSITCRYFCSNCVVKNLAVHIFMLTCKGMCPISSMHAWLSTHRRNFRLC